MPFADVQVTQVLSSVAAFSTVPTYMLEFVRGLALQKYAFAVAAWFLVSQHPSLRHLAKAASIDVVDGVLRGTKIFNRLGQAERFALSAFLVHLRAVDAAGVPVPSTASFRAQFIAEASFLPKHMTASWHALKDLSELAHETSNSAIWIEIVRRCEDELGVRRSAAQALSASAPPAPHREPRQAALVLMSDMPAAADAADAGTHVPGAPPQSPSVAAAAAALATAPSSADAAKRDSEIKSDDLERLRVHALVEAVKLGHPTALWMHGLWSLDVAKSLADVRAALRFMFRAANGGEPWAQAVLFGSSNRTAYAKVRLASTDDDDDAAAAFAYAIQAADGAAHPLPMYLVGRHFSHRALDSARTGTAEDARKGMEWLARLAIAYPAWGGFFGRALVRNADRSATPDVVHGLRWCFVARDRSLPTQIGLTRALQACGAFAMRRSCASLTIQMHQAAISAFAMVLSSAYDAGFGMHKDVNAAVDFAIAAESPFLRSVTLMRNYRFTYLAESLESSVEGRGALKYLRKGYVKQPDDARADGVRAGVRAGDAAAEASAPKADARASQSQVADASQLVRLQRQLDDERNKATKAAAQHSATVAAMRRASQENRKALVMQLDNATTREAQLVAEVEALRAENAALAARLAQ